MNKDQCIELTEHVPMRTGMPFRTPACRGLRGPPDLQDTSMHRKFSRPQTSGRKPIWSLCFPELTIDPAMCVTTVKNPTKSLEGT